MINRIFKIRGKNINYRLENFSDLSEQKAIDIALGCAFNMAQLVLHNLKTTDAKTARSMQKIYGENADAQKLADAFKKIVEHIEYKFFVRREKIFVGAGGAEMPEVFTGADKDAQKIIIYDAYFKTMPGDGSGLNDRPSVLIHEMAHLNGFDGDAELGDINSAEALRNFALLACELVDEKLLFEKIRAAQQDDNLQGEDSELPYRPDQPRAPKGQSNGGQWIEDNQSTNGGEIKSSNKFNKNIPSANDAPENKILEFEKFDDLVYREPDRNGGNATARNLDKPERFGEIKALAADLEEKLAIIRGIISGEIPPQVKTMPQPASEIEKNTVLLSQKTENTNSDTESTHNNSTAQDKQDSNKFNIPNNQYDKIKNEIKDSNLKDPVAYIGEIDKYRKSQFDFRKAGELEENDVGISHFPYRDINDREIPPGAWIGNDYVFGNLKPNSNEEFYQHTEFQYGDNNEYKTESADMYFQLPTNGDGMAFADRFVVFEANSDTLKKYPNLKIKSTIYHLPDGLPDGVKIDPTDNYNGPHADNGLSDYANRHARKFFKGGRTISKIKVGKKICETVYNIKDESEICNQ